jgi:hypothetical protein
MGAEAAPVQAKNPNGAENERDPAQDDARQMSQACPVHWKSVNAANPATSRWLTRRHRARTIVLHSLRFCPICARISLRRRATSDSSSRPGWSIMMPHSEKSIRMSTKDGTSNNDRASSLLQKISTSGARARSGLESARLTRGSRAVTVRAESGDGPDQLKWVSHAGDLATALVCFGA